jgi:hypothetical protein
LALTFDSLPDQGSFPKALNPGLKELLWGILKFKVAIRPTVWTKKY